MTFIIKTEVTIPAVGRLTHEHMQKFADDSNVFGRVVEYRQYMNHVFPDCKYRLIEAKEVKKA